MNIQSLPNDDSGEGMIGPPSTISIAMEDLRSFTLFRKLPTELRLKVWKATFPDARLISIRRDFEDDEQPSQGRTPPYFAFTVSVTGDLPIALSVCRESYGVANASYPPLLSEFSGCQWPMRAFGLTHTRINYQKDTLLLRAEDVDNIAYWLNISEIQNFAINVAGSSQEPEDLFTSHIWDFLYLGFHSLKTMQLVFHAHSSEPPEIAKRQHPIDDFHLLDVDSNFEDLIDYLQQKDGRGNVNPLRSLEPLQTVGPIARSLREGWRSLLAGGKYDCWQELSFGIALEATERRAEHRFKNDTTTWRVPYRFLIFNRDSLPDYARREELELPFDVWVVRKLCDEHGNVDSRYDDLSRLFEEQCVLG